MLTSDEEGRAEFGTKAILDWVIKNKEKIKSFKFTITNNLFQINVYKLNLKKLKMSHHMELFYCVMQAHSLYRTLHALSLHNEYNFL